jgi:hypothetical protein
MSLLYLRGASLHERDLDSGRDVRRLRLPSPDAYVAPRGRWVAVVRDARPPVLGEEDFAARPVLALVDLVSGRRVGLGPGFSPLWDASGESLAWLRPLGGRSCEGEVCVGRAEVVALGLPEMRSRVVLGGGAWGLISWLGDRLLVSDGSDLSGVVLASEDGSSSIALRPSEVWGASPDGEVLLRTGRGKAQFLKVDAGAGTGQATDVSGGSHRLAEGSWSPEGGRLAAVEIVVRTSGVPASRVVVVTRAGDVDAVAGSQGAAGPVLWSPSGKQIAFARAAGPGKRRLEAVVCAVEPPGGCRSLFSWRRGITLLRLEEG